MEDVLTAREREILERHALGHYQRDIAAELGCSQPSVHSALSVIDTKRKILASLPNIRETKEEMREVLLTMMSPDRVEILMLFAEHVNQTKIAGIVGRTQGYVRAFVDSSIAKIPRNHVYWKFFDLLRVHNRRLVPYARPLRKRSRCAPTPA